MVVTTLLEDILSPNTLTNSFLASAGVSTLLTANVKY